MYYVLCTKIVTHIYFRVYKLLLYEVYSFLQIKNVLSLVTMLVSGQGSRIPLVGCIKIDPILKRINEIWNKMDQ